MELCQNSGVHGVSFREIGERLGIRSASVHHHYPTKNDLMVALVRRYQDNFRETLKTISENHKEPAAKLKELFSVMESCLVSQDRCCLCAVIAVESNSVCCTTQSEVSNFFEATSAWVQEVLLAGRDSGAFRFSGEPKAAAMAMVAGLNGMVIASRRIGGQVAFKQMSDWWLNNLGVSLT